MSGLGRLACVCVLALSGCQADGPRPTRIDSASEQQTPGRSKTRKRGCIDDLLPGPTPEHEALYRALCSEWIDRDIPGLALAILDADGELIHVELGERCMGAEGLVTRTTPFRLGSLSKSVTAALALGAVAEGKLTRESAASVVEGYADQPGLATPQLGDLLRHRSGLGEIQPAKLVEAKGAWLAAMTSSPLAGERGEFHYANSGYVLIGAMLEASLGLPYERALRERLAQPLGLSTLTSDPKQAREPACGHLEGDADRHPISVTEDLAFIPGDPRWLNPAGGVLASAEQLARFALALGSPALPGSEAMLELGESAPMREGRPVRNDERYGDGLRSWTLPNGTRAYGHSGNNVAFVAELLFVPGQRAIVVLSNCGVGMPATLAAAQELLQTAP